MVVDTLILPLKLVCAGNIEDLYLLDQLQLFQLPVSANKELLTNE